MAEQQVIFPVDDWIEAALPDGRKFEVREAFLLAGYTGGTIMERDASFIRFSGLPQELTRAVLALFPMEYVNTAYSAYIAVGEEILFTDTQTEPKPIQVDITGLVKGVGGELFISIEPQEPGGVVNFFRKYGSVRGAQASRPRILLEGAPLLSPPVAELPPEAVPAPGAALVGDLMPLVALGLAGTAGMAVSRMVRERLKGRT